MKYPLLQSDTCPPPIPMTQICPKCRHVREANADCPAWQCPACQIAYSKVGGDGANFQRHPAIVTAPRSGLPLWKWLLPPVLLLGFGLHTYTQRHQQQHIREQAGHSQPVVIVYGTSWCGYCAAARTFLQVNGVAFSDVDIEKNPEGRAAYQKVGGNGSVPLIQVGEETMRGYSESHLRDLLAPWLKV